MKKLLLLPVLLATLTLGLAVAGLPTANANNDRDDLVGAWSVDADGAPYAPHLFTFNEDGTMLTTNPTNVQEDPAAPHGGTNDSVGMGAWKFKKVHGHDSVYIGTFYQLNANADDHTPTDSLEVTFKIKVTGDTFDGVALARVGSNSGPATLHGERLKINKTDADGLSL